MLPSNPLYSALEDDKKTAGTLVNTLIDRKKELISKIGPWQNAIKNAQKKANQTQADKNIAQWYQFSNVSYHSPKLRINDYHTKLLEQFASDPNYIFKNMVEIISRELIFKHLRSQKELENATIKVVNTSDFDDVLGGVDIIVMIEEGKEKSYLGLDIAVSSNGEYLYKKGEKTETYCMEYNLSQGLAPKMKIMRKVLTFSPEVMSELLYKYLTAVENGSYTNILDLYKSLNKGGSIYPGLTVGDTVNTTQEGVSNILQLN